MASHDVERKNERFGLCEKEATIRSLASLMNFKIAPSSSIIKLTQNVSPWMIASSRHASTLQTMASHDVSRPATYEPRTARQRQQELLEIQQYQSLVELIELKINERQYTAEVLQLTSQLLTKNPEYYTIWNVRRRLLTSGLFSKSSGSSSLSSQLPSTSPTGTIKTSTEDYSSSTSTHPEASTTTQADHSHQNHGKNGITLEVIQKELEFLIPLLRQWPKCYWIWNYRVWLLQEATLCLDLSTARRLWQEELVLVAMMLVKDSRNFHGWRYRRIIVDQLESLAPNGTSMVESEFEYTTKMIKSNLSNFSAWHNRSKLIPKLLDERKADDVARRKFLDEEFNVMRNALWVDPTDQSLWFYHQFLMTTIIDSAAHNIIVTKFSEPDRIGYVERQLTELKDLLDGAEDCKWIYNALIDHTAALWRLKGQQPPPEVTQDLNLWLAELRKLDRLRSGRWDDMAKVLRLSN